MLDALFFEKKSVLLSVFAEMTACFFLFGVFMCG